MRVGYRELVLDLFHMYETQNVVKYVFLHLLISENSLDQVHLLCMWQCRFIVLTIWQTVALRINESHI